MTSCGKWTTVGNGTTTYHQYVQVVPLWRVRGAAASSAGRKAQASSSRWKGFAAHVVTASPPKTPAALHKFNRKPRNGTGKHGDAMATSGPSQIEPGVQPAKGPPITCQPVRRGDEEFERQLQMALLATKESNVEPISGVKPKVENSARDNIPVQRPASLFWAEVFCGSSSEGAWVHADAYAGVVGAPGSVENSSRVRPALGYVVAFLGGSVKDVTRRYASSYVKSLRSRDQKWFAEVMKQLRTPVRVGELQREAHTQEGPTYRS